MSNEAPPVRQCLNCRRPVTEPGCIDTGQRQTDTRPVLAHIAVEGCDDHLREVAADPTPTVTHAAADERGAGE